MRHMSLDEKLQYVRQDMGNRSIQRSQRLPKIRQQLNYKISKPQLNFEDQVNNFLDTWKPKIIDLKYKPNAVEPLDDQIIILNKKEQYKHPYEPELKAFSPPESQLTYINVKGYKQLEETDLILVKELKNFKSMIATLKTYNDIALDLEHHSERSYWGFTCLMQISTRDTDYIIDVIALRPYMYLLNEVLTDPNILKIFHGGNSDIIWLQKDFSLYVVNMFDTHIASRYLDIKFGNLANLKKLFCDIDSDKELALTDWRVRPLHDELLKYAREDTHYLMFIKDEMTNLLIHISTEDNDVLKKVYDDCTNLCLKTHLRFAYSDNCYTNFLKNFKLKYNGSQLRALKEILHWRDRKAREYDESVSYILSTSRILKLVKILPLQGNQILQILCGTPVANSKNVQEILDIMILAFNEPLELPEKKEKKPTQDQNNQNENKQPINKDEKKIHKRRNRRPRPRKNFTANKEASVERSSKVSHYEPRSS